MFANKFTGHPSHNYVSLRLVHDVATQMKVTLTGCLLEEWAQSDYIKTDLIPFATQ
jgi:hypothetical protein